MAGTKRAADGEAGAETRASKAAKTGKSSPKGKKGGKRGPKAPATSDFKEKALPLHVNLTHTPPAIGDGDSVPASQADPGFINTISLIPSTFNTGSYGWKGNRRITVELQNGDEKEKVQVQLTINATVIGSKQAEGDKEGEEEDAKDGDADGENE